MTTASTSTSTNRYSYEGYMALVNEYREAAGDYTSPTPYIGSSVGVGLYHDPYTSPSAYAYSKYFGGYVIPFAPSPWEEEAEAIASELGVVYMVYHIYIRFLDGGGEMRITPSRKVEAITDGFSPSVAERIMEAFGIEPDEWLSSRLEQLR